MCCWPACSWRSSSCLWARRRPSCSAHQYSPSSWPPACSPERGWESTESSSPLSWPQGSCSLPGNFCLQFFPQLKEASTRLQQASTGLVDHSFVENKVETKVLVCRNNRFRALKRPDRFQLNRGIFFVSTDNTKSVPIILHRPDTIFGPPAPFGNSTADGNSTKTLFVLTGGPALALDQFSHRQWTHWEQIVGYVCCVAVPMLSAFISLVTR